MFPSATEALPQIGDGSCYVLLLIGSVCDKGVCDICNTIHDIKSVVARAKYFSHEYVCEEELKVKQISLCLLNSEMRRYERLVIPSTISELKPG